MKPKSILASFSVLFFALTPTQIAFAQVSPSIVWEAPTPSGLANSIQGVGWAPGAVGQTAFGSTDRWVRTRKASNGALIYSVLQPIRSDSADQTVYSTDGAYLAVHTTGGGLDFRVHHAADGVFLGKILVTVGNDGLVRFAPDAQLLAAVGGDGTMSRWRTSDFRVVQTIGSGYKHTTTTFNFSPNGAYQSAAIGGTIAIQARNDGSIHTIVAGGVPKSFTPVAFTPDSTGFAAWASSPNETTLWRVSDGQVLKKFPGAVAEEGVVAIRFSSDGARLVTTGYYPFVDRNGLWQQVGMIRFWRVSDGALRYAFNAHTGIGVTSPIAWSSDGSQFAYGTYEGTAVVARTPAP